MKKLLSLFLILSLVFSMTGCSETELKFAEDLKSFYTNKSEIVSTADIAVDPEKIFAFAADMATSLDDVELTDSEIKSLTDKFIEDARLFLDSDKKMKIHFDMTGKYDPISMYYDMKMKMSYNNYSIDLGNMYVRGNDIYISKQMFITMEQLSALMSYDSYMNDENYSTADCCVARILAYDKVFGDKDYAVLNFEDYVNEQNRLYQQNFGMVSPTFASNPVMNLETISKSYIEDIDSLTNYLSGYESGFFKEIENGVRFEINESNFDDLFDSFIKYANDNPEKASDYVNSLNDPTYKTYINMIYPLIIYNSEDETEVNVELLENTISADDNDEVILSKEDADVNENVIEPPSEVFNNFDLLNDNVTPEKIKVLCEAYNTPEVKESFDEFKTMFNNANSDLVLKYDIINKSENMKSVSCDINLTNKGNKCASILSEADYIYKDNIKFENITKDMAVDLSKVEKVSRNTTVEYEISTHEYNEDYCKNCEYYYCPYCDSYYSGWYTDECYECGKDHIIYEYDTICNKQPGCTYSCPEHGNKYYGEEYQNYSWDIFDMEYSD